MLVISILITVVESVILAVIAIVVIVWEMQAGEDKG